MRGKSPLVIMEIVVMLLVFAVAAAMCLGAFALAEDISEQTELRSEAVLRAQNCAETLRQLDGDFAGAAESLGGSWNGETLSAQYPGLSLEAAETESGHELLGKARITVSDDGGEELFTLECAWQRGGRSDG